VNRQKKSKPKTARRASVTPAAHTQPGTTPLVAMADQPESRSQFPEPPPSVAGMFFPSNTANAQIRKISRSETSNVWKALRVYFDAVRLGGQPYPGWDAFERELAYQFAFLLLFLGELPRSNVRALLLEMFLDGLNLPNQRGKARKAREQQQEFIHGHEMEKLWDETLQSTWNMKVSLEQSGNDPRAFLPKRGVPDKVVLALCSPKSTPESSLARVYSDTVHISFGYARNALRAYQKRTGRNFVAHV
jgi:hypothetical protein